MRKLQGAIVIVVILTCLTSLHLTDAWIQEKREKYTLLYTEADTGNRQEFMTLAENGIKAVEAFFSKPFSARFEVYVHPNRLSLEQQWRKDWGMPDFKSECWMVASGVALKLDILSPKQWDAESCEHSYSDRQASQRLVTHELVHVYHGQRNASPDFSEVENIDWFVEGLATYASGQCDDKQWAEIKQAVQKRLAPGSLDDFWRGNLRYGLSGSAVEFIDRRYGREKLVELLPLHKKSQILDKLKITEEQFLKVWIAYVEKR